MNGPYEFGEYVFFSADFLNLKARIHTYSDAG
jgi:hypothetical protein